MYDIILKDNDNNDFKTLCCSTWTKPHNLVKKGYKVFQLDFSGNIS